MNPESTVLTQQSSSQNSKLFDGLLPLSGIRPLIGNTPLLQISYIFKGRRGVIYAKAENLNLTGSIKDRMAYHIIKKAYQTGHIKKGDRIVEATSGNTGISFSAIGRALGHPVTIYMPDWLSPERINLIKSLGAQIDLISREAGGFLKSIELAENLAVSDPNVFLPRQFSNNDNCEAHYQTTGPEIWHQLTLRNVYPDAFVAGVGTGGTVMGVGRYLREVKADVRVFPLEPANSPTLSTGCKMGKHRIQGISDEFIPPILDLNFLDEVISVDDGDAIIMAQKLSSQLGLGVGISSGANFIGALLVKEKLGHNKVVATVFPDDNKKYLSTSLLQDEPCKPEFLSKSVDLLHYIAHKRVCAVCCDPENCSERLTLTDELVIPACRLNNNVSSVK